MTTSTDPRQILVVLPGATLREGLDNLRAQRDDASELAPVVPIRPIAGDDIEGKHQGHHRDNDRSFAACTAPEHDDAHPVTFKSGIAVYRCPKCRPIAYLQWFAKHSTEVSA